MSVYTIIRDWFNWCKKTGIIDAFLNDDGSTQAKSRTQASNRREQTDDGGLGNGCSDSEKQVAAYLDRALEMRRKAKDYLAKGLKGMAENCIQSYNGYIRLAEGLDEGMQTLTTMKMEARATQALGDLADTLQDAMDRRQEQEEQIRTNMDKLKDLHLRSLEIRNRMRSLEGDEEKIYKEGDLTCELLEEELAQEIKAETARSPLAEALAKGNSGAQDK